MKRGSIETPDGRFDVWFSNTGLCRLAFPNSSSHVAGETDSTAGQLSEIGPWLELTREALLSILSGRNPRKLPPLDLTGGTDFQRRVWRALLEIPAGETRSYREIARHIGSPGAMRAVGGACGANRIPVLIPCHRVIAAGGRIGGFSGEMQWKIKLLEREGAWPREKSAANGTQGQLADYAPRWREASPVRGRA